MPDDLVIESHDLTKRYGPVTAVKDLDLRVRRGEVYGLLGPNGAGKTTTLRMLLGLVRPTSGSAAVLGRAPGSSDTLARTGALIETPGFYPNLSGRDNLLVLVKHAGSDPDRIPVVLDQVRLTDRAHNPFATYSQGMKQRLGVAAALVGDPELVILDEPTNGLDPAGRAGRGGTCRLRRGVRRDVGVAADNAISPERHPPSSLRTLACATASSSSRPTEARATATTRCSRCSEHSGTRV